MLVFKKKQTFQLFLVLLKRTAFLAVLFLLFAPWQKISAVGFEEVCRGAGAGVCDSGLECDSTEDICLGSNGYVCQDNKDCANGLSCLSNHCVVDKGEQQGEKFGLGKSTSDIRDQIRTFINIFLSFLGVLGVLMVIYGGFLWMTSRGNAEQVKKAKQTLTYAVLGILVILLSWTITSYILYLGQKVGGGGGGGNGGGGPPILPVEPPGPSYFQMLLQDVSTIHAGVEPHQQVHPRCAINMIFNVAPTAESLSAALAEPPTIKVLDTTIGEPISRPYSLSANAITYDPAIQLPNQPLPALLTGNDHNLIIPINQNPFPIRGKSGEKEYLLQGCAEAMANCTLLETETHWPFTVGDDISQPPAILSDSLPMSAEENYNGNYIKLTYDRDIYPSSFITGQTANPDNIKFGQLNSNCEPGSNGCEFIPLPTENLIAYLMTGSSLKFIWQGDPWDAFAWYRLAGHNLKDSCGNDIADLAINFKTGAGAYLEEHPADNSINSCETGTKVWAWSSVSLFDPLTPEECGYNISGSFSDGSRLFSSRYNPLNSDGNPDPDCQFFDFLPVAKLDSAVKYQVEISSNLKINKAGDVLGKIWEFEVMQDALCDPSPVIEQLSPAIGPTGQCFTIAGDYFQGADFNPDQAENKIIFQTIPPTEPEILASLSAKESALWSDYNIVVYLPTLNPGGVDVIVQRHSEKLGILLISNKKSFTAQAGTIDNPICLTEVKGPNEVAESLAGEKITLAGQNFTFIGSGESLLPQTTWWNKPTSVQFYKPDQTDLAYSYYWTNESAMADAPLSLINGDYLISVHKMINPGEQDLKSNELKFVIKLPDPTKPKVENYLGCDNNRFQTPSPYPGRTDVCLIDYSGDKRVIFFLEYDRKIDTASANFSLEKCDTDACDSLTVVSATYKIIEQTLNNVNHEGVQIKMINGALQTYAWYQAKISGIQDEKDPNISADDYIWSFKTNENLCAIDKVDVSLNPKVIDYSFESPSNTSDTLATAINTATCQQLDASLFIWNWSAENTEIANMDLTDTDQNANNTAKATGAEGQTNIKAEENISEITGSAVLKVTTGDYTLCDPHKPESCNLLCSGSQCKIASDSKYHCTPVINTLLPTEGTAGTWLEIEGCYFGKQRGATGKVDFNGEADGIFDGFPEQCAQSLWTNEKILTEVPAMTNLEDKLVKVITSLKLESNDDKKFNLIDDLLLPQLCAVIPDEGKVETVFTAIGKFNDKANTTDISIGGKGSPGAVENKNEIKTKVAQDASLDEQTVKVIQDGNKSPQDNIKFTVLSNDPPIAPQQTFIKILDYSPKADNVCQNAIVSVEFNSRMEFIGSTGDITEGKVFLDGPDCISSSIPLITIRKNFYISYILNLLQKFFQKAKANGDCGVWQFKDDAHKEIKLEQAGKYLEIGEYKIKIKGETEGVKSEDDKILNKDNCGKGIWQDPYCVYTFSGGTNICEADRVSINSDVGEVFVYNVNYDHSNPTPTVGSYTDLIVTGYVKEQEINLIAPYYTPPVSWQVLPKSNIIKLYYANNPPAPQDTVEIAYAVKKGEAIIQGSDVVKAVVKVGEKELVDTIIATLALCEGNSSQYFWKFTDPNDIAQDNDKNRPTEGLDDAPGNFSLSYCRYRDGEPPLPLLSKDDPNGQPPTIQIVFPPVSQKKINKSNDILKEYYFKFQADLEALPASPDHSDNFLKQPYAKDFFILRIMPNWEQDYLSDWFIKEKDNLTGITLPSSITKQSAVDYAYEQADGGNILFVNALNLIKTDLDQECGETNCKMFTNVYILSYNEDAQDETKTIFNQLKTNWQFNINFLTDTELQIAVTQEKIQRDWQRIRDLNLIADGLEKYQQSSSGKYPYYNVLHTGVKPLGIAVSKWEDEWSKLGTALEMSLPYDPINVIQCKGTKGEQSSECFYQPGETGEKRGAYYCQAHRQCSDYKNNDDCESILNSSFCKWENDTCNDIEGNTGTYAYQYQLTGECYRYDEVEVKCNDITVDTECTPAKTNNKCIWQFADTDPDPDKNIRKKDQCESICSDPQNSAFQDKANYCFWKIEDQRCYSTATVYDLYANFEYSPSPWCNAKVAEYCAEHPFCQPNGDICTAPAIPNEQQPVCSGFTNQVFNVRYNSMILNSP